MFLFFFHVYFVSFRFPFVRYSSFKQTGSDQFWVTGTFSWYASSGVSDSWGGNWCWRRDALQCVSVTAFQQRQCSGYALRYSFFQCHCVHVDSLKRTLACMSVRQKWLCVTIFKPCVLHRHSHMCGQPVCFSVTLLRAHMHSSSLYRLQRFIGRSQWRCTPCLCVRVRVWRHLSNWWCFEIFSMPFSTGLCQRRRGEFCLHCLYRKKNKRGIPTFPFHKL